MCLQIFAGYRNVLVSGARTFADSGDACLRVKKNLHDVSNITAVGKNQVLNFRG